VRVVVGAGCPVRVAYLLLALFDLVALDLYG
jgi:hypothetical protein